MSNREDNVRDGSTREEGVRENGAREAHAAASATASSAVSEKIQCLIAPRRGRVAQMLGLAPVRAAVLEGLISELRNAPGCEIVRELEPRRHRPVSDGEATSVFVARMGLEAFLNLRARADSTRPELSIELDGELDYGGGSDSPGRATTGDGLTSERLRRALRSSKTARTQQVRLRVLGEQDEPIPNAFVELETGAGRAEGSTDERGELTLTTHAAGGTRSIFIDPIRGYWTHYLRYPGLNAEGENILRLRSLDGALGESRGARYGWGQRAMGLDQLPLHLTGRGAKIAIIDSGVDNQHPLLRHVTNGVDFTSEANRTGWTEDLIGHGSHGSGIIVGHDPDGAALRGFAPQAELHVLKVFPGGRYSTLLDALDYCIERQIDVVHLSVGGSDASEVVEQKLEEAVQSGVAFIAAAGDSGGNVQYPARSPHVLAVAALGALGAFPPNTWEAQTIPLRRELLARDGTFAPSFAAFGPEVALGGPGVGVVSAAVGGGFAGRSGTSVAAAHVTGIAALFVAHHPWFESLIQPRNEQRVASLYQLLRDAATPFSAARDLDVQRVGAGIPHVQRLLEALQRPSRAAVLGNPSQLLALQQGTSFLSNPFHNAAFQTTFGAPQNPVTPLLFRTF